MIVFVVPYGRTDDQKTGRISANETSIGFQDVQLFLPEFVLIYAARTDDRN